MTDDCLTPGSPKYLAINIAHWRTMARRLEEQAQEWRDLAAEPGIPERLRIAREQYADYDQGRAKVMRLRQRQAEAELARIQQIEAQA